MRCFIAIKFEPNEKIIEAMEKLKNKFRVKLVEPENLHATIKFLGEIDESMIEKISEKLKEIKFSKFNAELYGMGAFPSERKARVVWIGIKSNDFIRLGENVNTALKGIGEDQFSPHLTIARLKDIADVSEFINEYKNVSFNKYDISYFSLFKSTLTPNGPIYTEIKRFNSID